MSANCRRCGHSGMAHGVTRCFVAGGCSCRVGYDAVRAQRTKQGAEPLDLASAFTAGLAACSALWLAHDGSVWFALLLAALSVVNLGFALASLARRP